MRRDAAGDTYVVQFDYEFCSGTRRKIDVKATKGDIVVVLSINPALVDDNEIPNYRVIECLLHGELIHCGHSDLSLEGSGWTRIMKRVQRQSNNES